MTNKKKIVDEFITNCMKNALKHTIGKKIDIEEIEEIIGKLLIKFCGNKMVFKREDLSDKENSYFDVINYGRSDN